MFCAILNGDDELYCKEPVLHWIMQRWWPIKCIRKRRYFFELNFILIARWFMSVLYTKQTWMGNVSFTIVLRSNDSFKNARYVDFVSENDAGISFGSFLMVASTKFIKFLTLENSSMAIKIDRKRFNIDKIDCDIFTDLCIQHQDEYHHFWYRSVVYVWL